MKVHLWTRTSSWELHIILWYKTSGRQTTRSTVKQGSSKNEQQQQQQDQDPFFQHESFVADLGADLGANPAGDGNGSASAAVPWPLRHGLGERLPAGLQLPVSPRRGTGSHQELLQRAGRLGSPLDIRVSAHTWRSWRGQWLLVGRHKPCRNGVVSADSFLQCRISHVLLTVEPLLYFKIFI